MLAEEIVEAVANAVRGGLELGLSPEGILQMRVVGSDRVCEAFLSVSHGEAKTGVGSSPKASSLVSLDAELARAFSSGRLELRDESVRSRLQLRGDWAFVVALVSACTRPSSHTKRVFTEAAEKAKAQTCFMREDLGPPSEAVVRDCIQAGRPLVAKWWPALAHWNLETLATSYGHCMLDIGVSLGAVIARISAGEAVYTHGCKAPDGLAAKVQGDFYGRGRWGIPQLWMGSRSSRLVTGLHREVSSAFLVQVIGRKKLLLYRPDQHLFVYARRAHGSLQQCWVDPDEPDHARFPLFSKAEPLEITLAPGEALLIPPAWFHCAYALDDVLSIGTAIH
ncbi:MULTISPECIES: cupin-like domain-containing protein [unclassified Cupriavidus]|uniref:cupin-like domain-containing protein n=1 Tax=unclassified Cupriavidus TaxID=2640874 RepID=UPI00313BCFD4